MTIELAIQVGSSGRRIPLKASLESTLAEVLSTVEEANNASSVRYLQTTIPKSHWDTTTLSDVGLTANDRALLILESTTNSDSSSLQLALTKILSSNFDSETQVCLVTLMKMLDNILQKPGNAKVRSIRLSNQVVQEKIVSRGGVDFLLACGFAQQSTPAPLLSTSQHGEACLVLTEDSEDTAVLIQARRLLMQTAVTDLHMKSEDLPVYKPPPAPTTTTSAKRSSTTTTTTFNPYQGHRHNTTGQPQPHDSYVSTTEKRLSQLKSKQERLEAKLHKNIERNIVAYRPNHQTSTTSTSTTTSTSSSGPSDSSLLAQQFQRRQQIQKERDEGGFTTKAMRDLQRMQKSKVYSHCKLRIQFSNGSALECNFLPRETLQEVKSVVKECLLVSQDFDLYVAPPRRKLDLSKTLQEEGLVPAAKVFLSWVGGEPSGGDCIKSELYANSSNEASFPTAKPLVPETKTTSTSNNGDDDKKKAPSSSREDEMLRRMMGGGGKASKKKSGGDNSKKPKWFKG